jgi:hypothetical protein
MFCDKYATVKFNAGHRESPRILSEDKKVILNLGPV